jgi:hypothetical protein
MRDNSFCGYLIAEFVYLKLFVDLFVTPVRLDIRKQGPVMSRFS